MGGHRANGPAPAPESEVPMQRKTLPPGIRVRHARGCDRERCRCGTYEAFVFSKADGCKIRKTFTNLAEAKTWRQDALVGVRKRELRAPEPTTLRDAATDFLAGIEAGEILNRWRRPYKPSACRGYRHNLETFVLPDLGALRLAEVRRRDVQALVDRLVAAGYSGSKVRNAVVPVQAIYRRAMKRELVTHNPAVDLDLPESAGARERAASVAEATALIAAVPEGDRGVWATAFYAGLRRGELRALRVDDLDLHRNIIRVRRGWDDVAGEVEPKSRKGVRDAPISDTLRLVLLEHLARTGRRGRDLVFGRTASEPFSPTLLRRRAHRAWKAAKLEPIGLHEARHTYVSLMHAAGVPLERIGDYVGHSSSYMTDRYRHLLEGQRGEDAARFDALLGGATGAHRGAHAAQTAR
jgi:integrase